MKQIVSLLIILLIAHTIFGQKNTSYYVKDSIVVVGVKIVDMGPIINARFCTVKTKDGEVKFTPYEILEYGFGKTQYVARDIIINDTIIRIFLEKVITGNLTLYYFRDRGMKLFFIEDSLDFYTIDQKGWYGKLPFRQFLKNITIDSPITEHSLYRLSFTRQSMKEFVKRYNTNDPRPMHFSRYGVNFGAGSTILSPSVHEGFINLENFTFTKSYWFVAGVFLERPILYSNFSAVFSLDISQISGAYSSSQPLSDIDLLHKSTTVNSPLMARYTIRGKIISPYINTGTCFWYDISNKSKVYRISKNDNVIFLEPPVDLTLRKNMGIGFVAGAGLNLRITQANLLFLELRYIKQNVFRNNELNVLHFNKTSTQIYAGISF